MTRTTAIVNVRLITPDGWRLFGRVRLTQVVILPWARGKRKRDWTSTGPDCLFTNWTRGLSTAPSGQLRTYLANAWNHRRILASVDPQSRAELLNILPGWRLPPATTYTPFGIMAESCTLEDIIERYWPDQS